MILWGLETFGDLVARVLSQNVTGFRRCHWCNWCHGAAGGAPAVAHYCRSSVEITFHWQLTCINRIWRAVSLQVSCPVYIKQIKAVFFEIAVLEFSGWYWWKFLMARARAWGWNPRRIEDFEFILLSSNEEWNMWNSLAASLCFYYLSFYFGDIVLQTQFGGRPKPCRCMMNRLCFQIFQLFRIFVTKLWELHRVAREVDPSKLQGAAGQKGTMAQNRDAALWRSDFHFCFPFSFLILTC